LCAVILFFWRGKEKLCFILPLHRYNENNLFGDGVKKQASLSLSGYVDIIKERVTNYGIDIIDLSKEFPIPKTNKGDELTADGLHPNDIGHQIIANRVCEYLQKKGIE
jgi:lysophospholipase L1-like esterase